MRYWVYINEQVLERPFSGEELPSIAGFTRETLICPEIVPPGVEQEWVPARMLLEPQIEPNVYSQPAVEEYNPEPLPAEEEEQYRPEPLVNDNFENTENHSILVSKIDTLMLEVQALKAQLSALTENLIVVKSHPVETDPAALSNTTIERTIIVPTESDDYQAPAHEDSDDIEIEDIDQASEPASEDISAFTQSGSAVKAQAEVLEHVEKEADTTVSVETIDTVEDIKDMDTLLAGATGSMESEDFLQEAINTTFSRKNHVVAVQDPDAIVDLARKETDESPKEGLSEDDVPTVEDDAPEIHTEKIPLTEVSEVKEEVKQEEAPMPVAEEVAAPIDVAAAEAKAEELKAAYLQIQEQPSDDYYPEAVVEEQKEEAVLEQAAESEEPLEIIPVAQPEEESVELPEVQPAAEEAELEEPFEPKTIILDDVEEDLSASAPTEEEEHIDEEPSKVVDSVIENMASADYVAEPSVESPENLYQEEVSPELEEVQSEVSSEEVPSEPVYEEAVVSPIEEPEVQADPSVDLNDIPGEFPAAEEVPSEIVEETPLESPLGNLGVNEDVQSDPTAETAGTDREDAMNLEETDSFEEKSVLEEFAADKKENEEHDKKKEAQTSSAAYIIENSAEPKEAAITTLEELTSSGGQVAQEGLSNVPEGIEDQFLKTFTSSIEEVFLDQPTSIISDYVPPAIAESSDGSASPYDTVEPAGGLASAMNQPDAMANLMDLKSASPEDVEQSVRKVRRIKPAAIKTVPMVAANGEDINGLTDGAPNIDEAIAELGGHSPLLKFVKMFSAILVLLFIMLLFIALLASMSIIPASWSPAHSMLSKVFKKPGVEAVAKPTAEDILVEDALTEQQQREKLLQEVITTVKNHKLANGMTLNQKIVASHPKIADQIQWTADQAVDPSYFSIAAKLPPNQEGYSLTYRFSYNTTDGALVPTTSEANNIIQSAAAQALVQAAKVPSSK